tara:strand:- start:2424 stop:2675 length:252 start_codon:yes stop_codon:yes gene_type:complete
MGTSEIKRRGIISDVQYGPSQHDPSGSVLDIRVSFDGGTLQVSYVEPRWGAEYIPMEEYKARAASALTNMFRSEIEKALGLKP